jgi:hypothetical protein
MSNQLVKIKLKAFRRQVKIALRLLLETHVKGRTPVIVYQPGKVGSTSILNSLQDCGVSPTYHIHVFDLKEKVLDQVFLAQHILASPVLYHLVIKRQRPVKIITMVREPISRHIAGYFQIGLRDEKQLEQLSPEEVIADFLKRQARIKRPPEESWFEKQFKPIFGIDIYQHVFPKEEGALTLRQGNVDVLVFKSELGDSQKERLIADFLHLPHFRIQRANVGESKWYAQLYNEFKEQICLPEAYVDMMLNSRHVRHFYTDTEIAQARAKWLRPVRSTALR